jgi:hypothetical protein
MKFKQDINFLEYPLWFPFSHSSENGTVWSDREGYLYRTNYKAPDKTDILILFFILMESQKNNYERKLIFSQREILLGSGLPNDGWYHKRLQDSLERWINVAVKFSGTFYDGEKYESIGFHILEDYKIREKDKKVVVSLNENFLLQIKESRFFRYINFNQYKSLKRPVSLRLFEILCKTFKGRDFWEIDLVKLGLKLPLFKRKIYLKGEEKEVMYHSDVLVKIKPAIHEINKVAENKELFKSLEIPLSEAFSVGYELKKENKIIVFNKRIPDWVKQERSLESTQQEQIRVPKVEAQTKVKTEVKEAPLLKQLYEMSKSQTKSLKEAIKSYYSEKGFEYVKSNILYANKEAKKNYEAYLKKALEEDWGAGYREEEGKREESEKALQEKKVKEKEDVKKTYEKLDEVKVAYEALEQEEISRLEPLALEKCVAFGMPRDFIPKIILMEKIVELHQEEKQSKPCKKSKIKPD